MKDYCTTNMDFIKVSEELNSEVPLTLFNEDLFGLDLSKPNLALGIDLIQKIIEECVRNPWYFYRECLRLDLNKGTAALILASINNVSNIIVCLPRQSGVDTTIQAILLYDILFGFKHRNISIGLDKRRAYQYRNIGEVLYNSLPKSVVGFSNVLAYTQKTVSNVLFQSMNEYDGPWHESYPHMHGKANSYDHITLSDTEFSSNMIDNYYEAKLYLKKENGSVITHIHGITKRMLEKNKKLQTFHDDILRDAILCSNDIFVKSWDFRRPFLITFSYRELGFGEEWFRNMCATLNYNEEKIEHELLISLN